MIFIVRIVYIYCPSISGLLALLCLTMGATDGFDGMGQIFSPFIAREVGIVAILGPISKSCMRELMQQSFLCCVLLSTY